MPLTGCFKLDDENLNAADGYTHRKMFLSEIAPGARRNTRGELPQKGSAAGGGYSTCFDLYHFAKALLGFELVNEELTTLPTAPKVEVGTKNDQTLYYGYGFQILDVGEEHKRIGHAGSFAGANARLDIYPWLGITVVVLSNYDPPAAFKVANKAMDLLLD